MKWSLVLLLLIIIPFVSSQIPEVKLGETIIGQEGDIQVILGGNTVSNFLGNLIGDCAAGDFVYGINNNGFILCDTLVGVGGGNTTEEMQDAVGLGFTGNLSYDDAGNKFDVNPTNLLSWLDNIYVRISNLVSLVGNWSADKPNYYNKTYVYNKTEIDNSQYINQTYGNATYIRWINESNLNVNSSDYWDGLNTPADILGSQIQNDLNWINTSGGGANDGLFLNYTPVTTVGNITNGTLKGYSAGNTICDIYYDGSHMCTIDEILNTINQNVSNTNFTATFWASEGAPGYLANANDCDGWTSQLGTYLGSIWVGSTSHLNTYGSGSLVACSASRAISCCI